MTPLPLGPFLGENNLLPDTKLETKDGLFVRSAVNVDLTDAGTFTRRTGSVRAIPGTDCHSLWGRGEVGFFVDGVELYQFRHEQDPTLVASGLAPGRRMAFTEVPGEVMGTNGVELYRISSAGLAVAGIEPPSRQPDLAVAAGGSLFAGQYQVAISFLAPDGEESGASMPVAIDVPANGSLAITNIEQRAGLQTCVYVSPTNGDALFRYAVTGDSSLTVRTSTDGAGLPCRTMLLARMPAGRIIAYLNGRLFVAAGKILYYSEPYALALTNPAKNYIPFAEDITMVEPCQNGLYLSADQTYWIPGDIATGELLPVLPYKAVFGTSGAVPSQNQCYWYSDRGMILASQEGLVKNLQEGTVATNVAESGASMFREQNGMKQMVASLFGPQQTVMAASSFMDAEVIRKETIL